MKILGLFLLVFLFVPLVGFSDSVGYERAVNHGIQSFQYDVYRPPKYIGRPFAIGGWLGNGASSHRMNYYTQGMEFGGLKNTVASTTNVDVEVLKEKATIVLYLIVGLGLVLWLTGEFKK